MFRHPIKDDIVAENDATVGRSEIFDVDDVNNPSQVMNSSNVIFVTLHLQDKKL